MKRTARTFSTVLVLAAVQGCLNDTVSIRLNPDSVITIAADASETTGVSGPILLSPSTFGRDYTDNKDKIEKVALESIEFEVTKVYSGNAATQLLSASVMLINQNPNATQKSLTMNLRAPINIATEAVNTMTAFDPSPSDFLLEALKNGDSFTATISSSLDQAPVHIDLKIHLDVALTISVL